MTKILFDTDVLIEHLRENPKVTSQIADLYRTHNILACSAISEAEIYQGLRSNEREMTEKIMDYFTCLEVGRTVGRRAGEYLRKYGKSHGLELADALIAASSAIHKFALCTFNWKHYPMSEVERFRIDR